MIQFLVVKPTSFWMETTLKNKTNAGIKKSHHQQVLGARAE